MVAVLNPATIELYLFFRHVIKMVLLSQTDKKLKKLESLWAGQESLLIVMQDNPDPDAIAAACALKELANVKADITCQLSYGGTIGRAQNRELVDYLGVNLHPFNEIGNKYFDLIAMVDTQPATGNNPLPILLRIYHLQRPCFME